MRKTYKEKYNTDPEFRRKHKERVKIWNVSKEGRKWKHANYIKHISTERGYLQDKWHAIKKGGRKKLPIEITREEFYQMWEDHKKKYGGWFCAYTGVPMTRERGVNETLPENAKHFNGKNSGKHIRSNMSVDRIDSDKGYTKDNMVFCTWEFNDRKGEVSLFDIQCILNIREEKKHEPGRN